MSCAGCLAAFCTLHAWPVPLRLGTALQNGGDLTGPNKGTARTPHHVRRNRHALATSAPPALGRQRSQAVTDFSSVPSLSAGLGSGIRFLGLAGLGSARPCWMPARCCPGPFAADKHPASSLHNNRIPVREDHEAVRRMAAEPAPRSSSPDGVDALPGRHPGRQHPNHAHPRSSAIGVAGAAGRHDPWHTVNRMYTSAWMWGAGCALATAKCDAYMRSQPAAAGLSASACFVHGAPQPYLTTCIYTHASHARITRAHHTHASTRTHHTHASRTRITRMHHTCIHAQCSDRRHRHGLRLDHLDHLDRQRIS